MYLGILLTGIINNSKAGFYNSQEIGLAKELDRICSKVIVYKTVSSDQKEEYKIIGNCKHAFLRIIPTTAIGVNGLLNTDLLDTSLDALLYFSDTQISVPRVYKWCKEHRIPMFPYIGVLKSHSTDKMHQWLINLLMKRNYSIYKKCICFVKTPYIKTELERNKIERIALAPVGLDLSLVNKDYSSIPIEYLKRKYGYDIDDKVILFVGQMRPEKRPFLMVDIYKKLYNYDSNYKLLMVGKGELKKEVAIATKDLNVRLIDSIPNKDIWELYRIADAFVNLNKQEIFGMAILEAMYYECKVVAWHAPGPDYIIENGISGFLSDNEREIINLIENNRLDAKLVHKRIIEKFTWKKTANIIYDVVNQQKIKRNE